MNTYMVDVYSNGKLNTCIYEATSIRNLLARIREEFLPNKVRLRRTLWCGTRRVYVTPYGFEFIVVEV